MDEFLTHTYLEFTIKALNLINMWPSTKKGCIQTLKEYYILFIITVSTFPLTADFILQFYCKNPLCTYVHFELFFSIFQMKTFI